MKAMKSLGLNRMMGSSRRKDGAQTSSAPRLGADAPPLETPEANAERAVRSFCESGGPNSQPGEEVLYLPTIVDSAESSPAAAKECAYQIRKVLARGGEKPYTQYNAIMLMRILSDNPGETFTRNIDVKFVGAVKDLLRMNVDQSVTQILMETLDNFEREKQYDTHLAPLLAMWKKEQARALKAHQTRGTIQSNQSSGHPRNFAGQTEGVNMQTNYFSRSHQHKGLPPPAELSTRIEEAKNSAKLLTQLTRSTPPQELLANDLVREFANRCISASRSIQGYMTVENPGPDNDTMLTLIETNEQLSLALTKHQRPVLESRKVLGLGTEQGTSPAGSTSSMPGASRQNVDHVPPPPGPPPGQQGYRVSPSSPTENDSRFAVPPLASVSAFPVPTRQSLDQNRPRQSLDKRHPPDPAQDPFQDPIGQPPKSQSQGHAPPPPPEAAFKGLAIEPYHPGFNPTQSYMGRQDSAMGKLTMHAAIPGTPDLRESEEDLYGASSVENTPAGGEKGKGRGYKY